MAKARMVNWVLKSEELKCPMFSWYHNQEICQNRSKNQGANYVREETYYDVANVYILTEQGKEYTKEGIQFIIDKLSINNNIQEYMFYQGKTYNNPEYLVNNLKTTSNNYIILSDTPKITVMQGDNIAAAVAALSDNLTQDSWKILTEVCYAAIAAASQNKQR